MKTISAALIGASLLALGACSGGEDVAVNNAAAYDPALEDLSVTDNGLDPVGDTLGNDLNSTGNSVGNIADEAIVTNSVTTTETTVANTAGNSQ